MDYESKFIAADNLRAKTQRLLIALMIISIAPVFYSLVESFEGKKGKVAMVVLGSLFAFTGSLAAFLIEIGKL